MGFSPQLLEVSAPGIISTSASMQAVVAAGERLCAAVVMGIRLESAIRAAVVMRFHLNSKILRPTA